MEKSLINQLIQIDMPDWVSWLAQDADGKWWGYEVEPHQHDHGWYENEIGRFIELSQSKPDKKWSLNIFPRKK